MVVFDEAIVLRWHAKRERVNLLKSFYLFLVVLLLTQWSSDGKYLPTKLISDRLSILNVVENQSLTTVSSPLVDSILLIVLSSLNNRIFHLSNIIVIYTYYYRQL